LLIRTNDDVRTALIRYRRPTMANQMIGVMWMIPWTKFRQSLMMMRNQCWSWPIMIWLFVQIRNLRSNANNVTAMQWIAGEIDCRGANCDWIRFLWPIFAAEIDRGGRSPLWKWNAAELIVTKIDCGEADRSWNSLNMGGLWF
jgi:hypothetical protein